MSGVVLRCPNCGTTRGTPGECDACHEAEVRYYCTNHTPGTWLDAPKCPSCGARFGEAARPPAAASKPTRPTAAAPSPPPATPGRRRSVPWRPEIPGGPWTTRRKSRAPTGGTPSPYGRGEPGEPRIGSWPELLREAAARARRSRVEPRPGPDPLAVGAAFGGCLMRAVVLAITLFIAFLVMSFLVGGFFLTSFGGGF